MIVEEVRGDKLLSLTARIFFNYNLFTPATAFQIWTDKMEKRRGGSVNNYVDTYLIETQRGMECDSAVAAVSDPTFNINKRLEVD